MEELELLKYARVGAESLLLDAQKKLSEIDVLISGKEIVPPPMGLTITQTRKFAIDAKKEAGAWKVTTGKPKKKFSAATRKRMSEAQKLRRSKTAEAKAA